LFSGHSSNSTSAGFLCIGIVFTPEMASPAATTHIYKEGKQVHDQTVQPL